MNFGIEPARESINRISSYGSSIRSSSKTEYYQPNRHNQTQPRKPIAVSHVKRLRAVGLGDTPDACVFSVRSCWIEDLASFIDVGGDADVCDSQDRTVGFDGAKNSVCEVLSQ